MGEEKDSNVHGAIIKQIEYYFGDFNLPRDKFLQGKIYEDKEGWVSMDTMLKFKRLANICSDSEIIAEAITKSESKLVELSEDKKSMRRNPEYEVPEMNDERKKKLMEQSAYVKGFPLKENLHEIIDFMEEYGPINSVIKRMAKDKFKGSCFIIFKDVETAKKFVGIESIKYKDTELIRKMQNDYHADKKKEIEERKKSKKEKVQADDEVAASKIELPKGTVVQFTGIEEGKSLTREEIKEKFAELSEAEVAYIDFNKGDVEGYVRFSKENGAIEFKKKIGDDDVEVGESKLKLKVLEGEEEDEYMKKTSQAMVKNRNNQKNKGRKRKGNFGGGGRKSKQGKKD